MTTQPTKATTRAICNSSVRQVYVPPKNDPVRPNALDFKLIRSRGV